MFVTVAGHFNNKVSLSTGKVKSVIAKYVYFLYLYSLPLTKDMKCVQLNMYSRPNLYCLWSALALSFRTDHSAIIRVFSRNNRRGLHLNMVQG